MDLLGEKRVVDTPVQLLPGPAVLMKSGVDWMD